MPGRTVLPRRAWPLLVARGVNELGAFTLPFLTVLFTRTLRVDIAVAGAIVAVFGVATIPSRILGGHLADRLGYRATIVVGLLATAVGQIAAALAESVVFALTAALFLGLAFEIYEPPSQAMLAAVTREEDRARAYGLQSAVLSVAGLAAGLLATLVGRIDLRLLFVIDAATGVAAAVIVAVGLRGARERPAAAVRDRGRSPWRDRALLTMLAVGTVFACVYFQVNIALPLTLADRGIPPSDLGLVIVVSTAAAVVGQPLLGRRFARIDPFRAMTAGFGLLAVGYLVQGLVTQLWQFLAVAVVNGVAGLILMGHAYAVVTRLAPPDRRGSYLSVYGLSWGIGAVIAPLGGTQALQHLGVTLSWTAVAVACALLALVQPLVGRVVRST